MNGYKPIIGISMGDPASIGPEVTIKAVVAEKVRQICRPIVVGDANVLQKTIKLTGLNLNIHKINKVGDAQFKKGIIDVFDMQNVDITKYKMGKVA